MAAIPARAIAPRPAPTTTGTRRERFLGAPLEAARGASRRSARARLPPSGKRASGSGESARRTIPASDAGTSGRPIGSVTPELTLASSSSTVSPGKAGQHPTLGLPVFDTVKEVDPRPMRLTVRPKSNWSLTLRRFSSPQLWRQRQSKMQLKRRYHSS